MGVCRLKHGFQGRRHVACVRDIPGSLDVFLLDLQIDLFAMHRDVSRGRNSKPDLIASHFNHGNLDVVTDLDALVGSSG
jgi:hypothetical protein